MKKKIYLFFFVITFLLFQNKLVFSQIENSIIISVGDYPITRLDLLKEIKLIAILSNTQIDQSNREQIKGLAVKSLIKRNIKENEIKKRNVYRYNKKQLEDLITSTSKKIGLDKNGLKETLLKNNLSYEELIKRFETDLKWNFMIFQIYKNKISLNTAEIESKLQLRLENLKNPNDQKIEVLKEQIVNSEKEKKLKMFSNMHFSNLERSIQINFL
ncbi:MAG: hypothetical protein CMF94_05600 [Candidatus Marinimicrobia bacterium]|nr:hypothetical protein [Candidatus Neomarinimicrobiota bacterium]